MYIIQYQIILYHTIHYIYDIMIIYQIIQTIS